MDSPDDINTLAGRLATFERSHPANKRRASAASKKKAQSTLSWPHASPTPDQLARAGFYYKPSSASNDSVSCFLCGKALDGWDPQDDPALEHLSHVPTCGWAINVCIERRSQDMDRAEQDPLSDDMIQARRSTFKDVWPHESKKGWKCKVQKMVEAGWCYSPLPEADDCVHCFYCGVSLDGWEPKDDPWDEHRRRAPECHFFTLIDESAKLRKQKPKAAKGRQSRASKSSRLSTQSNITAISDVPSLELDDSAADDDGDTVLTTVSVVSKPSKGTKKAAKGKAAPKKTRAARGAKEPPAADESSLMSDLEPSNVEPSKTRATRTRKPSVMADSVSQDIDMSEGAPKKTRATRTKKAAAVQDVPSADGDGETSMQPDTTVTGPPHPIEQPKTRAKQLIPETGTTDEPPKALVRKVSRAKGPKSKQRQPQEPAEAPEDADASAAPEPPKPTRGKKRTSDGLEKVDSSVVSVDAAPPKRSKAKAAAPKRGRAASRAATHPVETRDTATTANSEEVEHAVDVEPSKNAPLTARSAGKPSRNAPANEHKVNQQDTKGPALVHPPPTPPSEPSKQSPTVSPQSSNAENHPPSSRPSLNLAKTGEESPSPKRRSLKPTTPTGASPSRNVIAGGLTSTAPWTPVDLEHIFLPSPSSRRIQGLESNENATVEQVMMRMSSPEKKMSVEQWIMWNAQKAEERLKGECERLISAFEGEGVKALRALEGIECA